MAGTELGGGRHYIVGGGIAGLATAVFLVRDAGVSAPDILILEAAETAGGSLDGCGDADTGYLTRGGRMFESNFACTFDLLASIPLPDDPKRSVKDDIDAFNREVRNSSRCRLIRNGQRVEAPPLSLGVRGTMDLLRLVARSESRLEGQTIESCFGPAFFASNFWLMWSTMFSFQPWHSAAEMRRYLKRFVHLFPGFSRLEGILRTRFNQYDSIIAPIVLWLTRQGVEIRSETAVLDAEVEGNEGARRTSALRLTGPLGEERVSIAPKDRVYFTLGSMTSGAVTGSRAAAPPAARLDEPGWVLWRRLAEQDAIWGRPDAFAGTPEQTSWTSFTVTLRNPAFLRFMEDFTRNPAGTGGLVTLAGSGWTLSIVLFHQPHFRGQPDNAYVFWGYGLRGDRPGDFVVKPMAACTGEEILEELSGHLGLGDDGRVFFEGASVVPCRMPYITSQFMPRAAGDRPPVVPEGAVNSAVIGQFCEMPRDTVFTVEYSVRSAKEAVHRLTGRAPAPPPVKPTDRNPAVLARAALTLLRG
ncbi:MAG TPA: oleate hydratase [Alphaproteobacteria bacterium]|nr:oleate hydratase [Alphaproteobacteria bacterium]